MLHNIQHMIILEQFGI